MGQAERPAFLPLRVTYGAIAQLVEHLHGMQGVSGSSPLGSIFKNSCTVKGFFYAQSPEETFDHSRHRKIQLKTKFRDCLLEELAPFCAR
jgi:hypothetical protein